jgi:hypothetical protein
MADNRVGLLDAIFQGKAPAGLLGGGGGLADTLSPGRSRRRTEELRKLMAIKQLEQSMGINREELDLKRKEFQWKQDQANRPPENVRGAAAAGFPMGSKEMQEALFPRTGDPEKVRNLRAAGIDPTSEQGRRYLLGREHNPSELRAIHQAQDEVPALQGTVETLNRALDLNPQIYPGWQNYLGKLGGQFVQSIGLTPGPRAQATMEWDKTMSAEALTAMADQLKGSTAWQEILEYKRIIADPSQPEEVRRRVIERLRTIADRQLQIKRQRLRELGGSDPTQAWGGQQQPQPGGQAPSGGDGWSVQRIK